MERKEVRAALQTAAEIVLEKGNVSDELLEILLDNEEIVATAQWWQKSVQNKEDSENEKVSEISARADGGPCSPSVHA
jgi:hypothetical protein